MGRRSAQQKAHSAQNLAKINNSGVDHENISPAPPEQSLSSEYLLRRRLHRECTRSADLRKQLRNEHDQKTRADATNQHLKQTLHTYHTEFQTVLEEHGDEVRVLRASLQKNALAMEEMNQRVGEAMEYAAYSEEALNKLAAEREIEASEAHRRREMFEREQLARREAMEREEIKRKDLLVAEEMLKRKMLDIEMVEHRERVAREDNHRREQEKRRLEEIAKEDRERRQWWSEMAEEEAHQRQWWFEMTERNTHQQAEMERETYQRLQQMISESMHAEYDRDVARLDEEYHLIEEASNRTLEEMEEDLEQKEEEIDELLTALEVARRRDDEARHQGDRSAEELNQLSEVLALTKSKLIQVKKENKALRMHKHCTASCIEAALQKGLDKGKQIMENSKTLKLKEKGVFTESARALIRDLAKHGVPSSRIDSTIHVFAAAMGVAVEGHVSERTVNQVILEGGVASMIQVVEEVHVAEAIALSGDGSTLRSQNVESKHVLLPARSYEPVNSDSPPKPGPRFVNRSLGIMPSIDHKSETQFQGWKDAVCDMYELYNQTPNGKQYPINPAEFAANIAGMCSDHAADQKKLARFIEQWKKKCLREIAGEQLLLEMELPELMEFLFRESERNIKSIGGIERWEALPEEERIKQNKETYKRTCQELGEESFAKLTDTERKTLETFVWGGCCMHKAMNATKGGYQKMSLAWGVANLDGPVKLMNKDNAAAAAKGGETAAKERAEEVSQGGAFKALSLAGLVFHNNKDDKKGHQDNVKLHGQASMATNILNFPDTSNTRYQSYEHAAEEVVINREFYVSYLHFIGEKKGNGELNHMEANVLKAFEDVPTLTEMVVLVLYSQAISQPYMRFVRKSDQELTNLLDLGPLHDQVKIHCQQIVDNPEILLSPDATYVHGALDGQQWHRPEAIYAAIRMMPNLPDLRTMVVAFFKGALETWERFTTEFLPGGVIANLSEAQREKIFIKPTNDDNEGGLGIARIAK
ncbi:hypothetical protein JAAARDRAFT_200032 [Jaapia argillacea MUCL 33604]|uniref:Uncharacterized protein n=1 Tax=Jaapia argillacea MUCL 33604 TaxID=933084 RepID=A0A067P944_9AGAM|nr:hypothetical protein JAAARDRAFT_200032 [Jaapia argillacea MUCL 33604]